MVIYNNDQITNLGSEKCQIGRARVGKGQYDINVKSNVNEYYSLLHAITLENTPSCRIYICNC